MYLFTLEILFKNGCPPGSSFHFISLYKTQHENFPSSSVGKRTHLQCRRHRFDPWVRKISRRRKWQPTPVFLPGKSMDRGAWQATVHGVTKIQTWLSNYTTTKLSISISWANERRLNPKKHQKTTNHRSKIYKW